MTKKTIFSAILSGIVLSSGNVLAVVDCAQPPECEKLGYTDDIGLCPSKYVACPFDKTKGSCILEADIGQIGYFTVNKPLPGWILCNGASYKQTDYPELASYLGTSFCNTNHGGTCTSGYFRVPKYTGYFLRVVGTPSSTYGGSGNSSTITPQKEQLPDITGSVKVYYNSMSGTFSENTTIKPYLAISAPLGISYSYGAVNFNASDSSSIYQTDGHVIPANYAVYAYIYAGRYGEGTGYKVCEVGDGYDTSVKKCYELAEGENRLNIYVGDDYYSVVPYSGSSISKIEALNTVYSAYKTDNREFFASEDFYKYMDTITRMVYNYTRGNGALILTADNIVFIPSTGYQDVMRVDKSTTAIQQINSQYGKYYKTIVIYREKIQ